MEFIKKIRGSSRGITFTSDHACIGTKYRYIIDNDNQMVNIIADDNGSIKASKKRCGQTVKALFDLRSKKITNLIRNSSYMEIEEFQDHIIVRVYKKKSGKICLFRSRTERIENVLGIKAGEIIITNDVLQEAAGGFIHQEEYGKYILETCYDGYGHFGNYDVYELVALWNRKNMPLNTSAVKEPELSDFDGLWDFEKEELRKKGANDDDIEKADKEEKNKCYEIAKERYHRESQMLCDFKADTPDEIMKQKYGKDFLRIIGIDIACEDEDNFALKFPIKITSVEMSYSSANPSKSDPYQGWEESEDEEECW